MACCSRGHQQQQLVLPVLIIIALIFSGGTNAANSIPTFEVFSYLAVQGPNSTQGYNTVRCGGPATPQANQFGEIFCFDMPLLKTKSLTSELLGRVQGTYTVSQLTGGRVFVTETFILNGTSLRFKGSISALGIENIQQNSSKPITGGTDDYELVSGNAFTYPLDGGGVRFDTFGNAFFWFMYKFVFDQQ